MHSAKISLGLSFSSMEHRQRINCVPEPALYQAQWDYLEWEPLGAPRPLQKKIAEPSVDGFDVIGTTVTVLGVPLSQVSFQSAT